MKLIQEPQYDFDDLMLKPKRSELGSRADVDLIREFKGKWNPNLKFSCIPIVCANMDNIANWDTFQVLLSHNFSIAMNKFTPVDEWKLHQQNFNYDNPFFYTIGIRDENELNGYRILRKQDIFFEYYNKLIIDVPNAYTSRFLDFVKQVRNEFPDIYIMCGNVVSAEQTEELILSGADCVKVGIGSGSNCSTRLKTGVGRPQASTIIECSDAAHGIGGYICSDGGCNTSGDIAKAFCLGADMCMIGGMFAGHDECDGEVITQYDIDHYYTIKHYPKYKEKKFKQFWGMSSTKAMEKHYGTVESHKTSEGLETLIPYRGELKNTIQDICGGLNSACTYIGARNIKDMPKCATFYITNQQVNHPYKNINNGS